MSEQLILFVTMAIVLLFSAFIYLNILNEVEEKLGFERKLLTLFSRFLLKSPDVLDFTEVNMKSHSVILQVYDAITEQDKTIQYKKVQIAHNGVRNYVKLVGAQPIILVPKPERPVLKAVK
ncbi:hypothetical protein ACSLBF_08120 [Pseudoalteromonas sp. T1lg65]|uniref:hypothetical protein n=1 Tax=Pseudoalteromonas sp. T1lg65 TaxID=2077101 RepID=UPI003F79E523